VDFVKYITTPANTAENAPQITTIKLTRGKLTGGWIYFPSGPAGLLHFFARIGIHQLVPFSTGENLRLDNCLAPLSLGIEIQEPPFEIDCVTWNTSTDYAHALTVCFSLEPIGKKVWNLNNVVNEFAGTNGYPKP